VLGATTDTVGALAGWLDPVPRDCPPVLEPLTVTLPPLVALPPELLGGAAPLPASEPADPEESPPPAVAG
jgi:hypothetical protein